MPPRLIIAEAGSRYRHRFRRIYARTRHGVHRLCWLLMERDWSLTFGFSDRTIYATRTGSTNVSPQGRFDAAVGEEIGLEPAARRAVRITLHPSGIVNVRTAGGAYVFRHRVGTWLPVASPLEWLHIYTAPARHLALANSPKPNSFVIDVDSDEKSLYLPVYIYPPSKGRYVHDKSALACVYGECPKYYVRVGLKLHEPTRYAVIIPRSWGDPRQLS